MRKMHLAIIDFTSETGHIAGPQISHLLIPSSLCPRPASLLIMVLCLVEWPTFSKVCTAVILMTVDHRMVITGHGSTVKAKKTQKNPLRYILPCIVETLFPLDSKDQTKSITIIKWAKIWKYSSKKIATSTNKNWRKWSDGSTELMEGIRRTRKE